MKKYITLLLFSFSLQAQITPVFFPNYESNRGKGNGKLYYRLFSLNSSLVFPNTEAEMDAFYTTYGTFKTANIVSIATNSGTTNSTNSSAFNLINYSTTSQFTSAIGTTTPYSGFSGDYYGLIITGYFIPKQSGSYKFAIEGDDAVDVMINGTTVTSHYGGHGASPRGTHTGSITLIAGKKYSLRVRFMENTVGDELYLFWQKPSETSGSVWYQDAEELSSDEAVPSGLVFNVDPSNMYSFPRSGTNAFDLKGNATGTIGGNMTYSSIGGGTFLTDGNGDYVDFGKMATSFPTGDISAFVWVRPSILNYGWNIILTKWFQNTDTGGYSDFHFAIYPNGASYYQNLYTTTQYNLFGSTAMAANTWYHMGFTISNGFMQMYLNGVTDGALRTNSRTNYPQSSLWLGDARTGVGGLVGNLGSVLIYNRGITADEVLQNYNATKHKYGL